MDQGGWAKRNAVGIGERIARYRDARKLSAQQLADRCAEIGMPSISRVVITKLENGRREAVSTAELQVLAKALGVPPALLLFPLGQEETVEVTPGQHVAPMDAIYWLSGQDPDIPGRAIEGGSALDLFMLHLRTVNALLNRSQLWADSDYNVVAKILRPGDPPFPPLPEEEKLRQEMEYHVSVLRNIREAIRKLGLVPPKLPRELSHVDGQEGEHGAR